MYNKILAPVLYNVQVINKLLLKDILHGNEVPTRA